LIYETWAGKMKIVSTSIRVPRMYQAKRQTRSPEDRKGGARKNLH
jgi:hypothetical protein